MIECGFQIESFLVSGSFSVEKTEKTWERVYFTRESTILDKCGFPCQKTSFQIRTMLSVWPKSSLIDKITKIYVSRLKPLQKITLGAKLLGDKGEVFESHAHYIADKHGEVDVCRDSSVGGSYSGVSPMGLLWSMKPAPGQRKAIRLMKSDVTKPYTIELKCFSDHISPRATSYQPLTSVTFKKWYMTDGVKRIPVREGRIRGTLFLPPGNGPFPGIFYY